MSGSSYLKVSRSVGGFTPFSCQRRTDRKVSTLSAKLKPQRSAAHTTPSNGSKHLQGRARTFPPPPSKIKAEKSRGRLQRKLWFIRASGASQLSSPHRWDAMTFSPKPNHAQKHKSVPCCSPVCFTWSDSTSRGTMMSAWSPEHRHPLVHDTRTRTSAWNRVNAPLTGADRKQMKSFQ